MAASLTQVRSPTSESIKILKWKVRKDSTVTKGTVLALYEIQGNTQSSDQLKLKSNSSGIVAEICVETGCIASPGAVLMTLRSQSSGGCTHPTVMKDMCADCGADLRREPGVAGDRKEAMTASVAMVHNIPELIVSQEQALELGREDEQRLLKTRKLVLLVDLDQTLIHTTNDNIPPNLKDVFHFQMWQGPYATWYHTRLRPHTRRFLERVSQMYELHICTFGVRLYAHTVARLIDPDERIFAHRILSRDECFDPLSKTANLKALFPCGDSMVCIIDDREDVWNFAPNLVHVKPYRFFQGTADINAPPGLAKTENDDVPITHKVIDHHHPDHAEHAESGKNTEHEKQAPDKAEQGKDSGDAPSPVADSGSSGGDGDQQTQDTLTTDKDDDVEKMSSDGNPESSDTKIEESSEQCQKDPQTESMVDVGGSDDVQVRTDLPERKMSEEELADDLRISSESESDLEKDSLSQEDSTMKEDTSQTNQTGADEYDKETSQMSDRKLTASDQAADSEETVSEVNSGKVQESSGTAELAPDTAQGTEQSAAEKEENSAGSGAGSETNTNTSNDADGDKKSGTADSTNDAGDKQAEMGDGKGEDEDEIEWDDEDDYLLHLEEILTRIHKAFYTMYDEGCEKTSDQSRDASPSSTAPNSKSPTQTATDSSPSRVTTSDGTRELPDLKSIIPYVKRKTLKGCNLVFSGLVPLNTPVEKSRAFIVAKALGATVQPEIVGPKDVSDKSKATTHLVAQKPGTGKHKTALRTRGIHIVNSGWLWSCGERWERCDERLFPLGRDTAAGDDDAGSKKHKPKKGKRKRESGNFEKEEDEDSSNSDQKRQKRPDEVGGVDEEMTQDSAEAGADQLSEGEMSLLSEKSGSTVNPLLSFSDEDLECMDKEVDELLAEEASDSSDETEGERNERMRKVVLGEKDTESSSDSLSGDLPRGWGLRRKSSPQQSEDDLEKQKLKEVEIETEDTENEMVSYEKTVDTFAPDSESNTSFAESIGSVDDEIADAVEKEFLASL